MKDKQQKGEKVKAYDAPVTKLELHQELKLVKIEIKQEVKQEISDFRLKIRQEMFDFKKELTQVLQQEFSKFTTVVCQQIEEINDNFENRFKENEQEHINLHRKVKICEAKLNI
jgi:SMC interacting uncharacterized protein involved in chromosome segregation